MLCRSRLVLAALLVSLASSSLSAASWWVYVGSGTGRCGCAPTWVQNPLWWSGGLWISGSSWSVCIGSCDEWDGSNRAAWDALDRGSWRVARDAFQARVNSRPGDGGAWIGLALARGAGGNDALAESAMRRAIRLGLSRSLRGVPESQVTPLLERLETRYATRAQARGDRWFLVAAVRAISGDRGGARAAADRALRVNRFDAEARAVLAFVRARR